MVVAFLDAAPAYLSEQRLAPGKTGGQALLFYRSPKDPQIVECDCEGKSMKKIDVVVAALERAPDLVVPLVQEVPETIVKRRPRPGKWSAHEHACHLATIHPVMSARLNLMLADPKPRIVPYFPSAQEEEGALLKVDLGEAMERFSSDRRRLIERLKTLSAAEWQRTAEHDEYNHYSVFIMFRHLAMHDLFHAYRIEELLLKNDWE